MVTKNAELLGKIDHDINRQIVKQLSVLKNGRAPDLTSGDVKILNSSALKLFKLVRLSRRASDLMFDMRSKKLGEDKELLKLSIIKFNYDTLKNKSFDSFIRFDLDVIEEDR